MRKSREGGNKEVEPANPVNEAILFEYISKIIENRKTSAAAYANREVNLMFWEIGRYINSAILDFKRAAYGKKIFSTLSRKLVEMDKAGIAVAEYWTALPPKNEFEKKIREILTEAKERLERQKALPAGAVQKQIEYFIDKEEDDDA